MERSNNGGGSSRRRRRCDVEEEDEWKMEQFLDLIHNLRESVIRNHSHNNGWLAIARNKRIENNKGVWEPRFELQDFADHHHHPLDVAFNNNTASNSKPTPPRPPPSGLDLNLSL